VKTYRKASDLLAEVKQAFASRRTLEGDRPIPHPLENALLAVLAGRHYSGLELALDVGEGHGLEFSLGSDNNAASTIAAPVRLGARQFGELRAFNRRENAFPLQDRVLLKELARGIALFLTGPGKKILRRAHEQSASAAAQTATAGENPRS
jgi:hypothetical protein